jgi:hypothetical protein
MSTKTYRVHVIIGIEIEAPDKERAQNIAQREMEQVVRNEAQFRRLKFISTLNADEKEATR